ncbi:MAG: M14 family metallopeptidase [Clostridiaceae bacterium]|nr:M14 family metallopeptidase [Clostridiaceae bacterium]
MSKITKPEEHFGFRPGADCELARWDKIVEYFYLLEKQSDRISVTDMGPSTEGNPFLKVIITSPQNHRNLEEIRQASMALADPRGLSDEEIKSLVKKGKAVSVQSMSLHATEVGGTQMAVNLAYDLVSQSTEEIMNILDNVVFVMVPCFNPDGQIMVTDWYYSTKGTPYEGSNYPKLYHKYTGHDNNRDAFAQNIIESRYMGQILFHEWMPQSYQDHHHMGSYGARIQIAPYKNPLRQYVDPLVWRELNWYGANMAYQMDENGLDGVSSGAQYPAWGHYGYHWITNSHNIAGMLTESASAKLASPKYIDPTQLKGDGDIMQPDYEAQTNFPSPWPGGWWRLGDIVNRMYMAAYALLDTMARNREAVLSNMARKALNQTERGAESGEYAYIIPENQHDKGEVKHLIRILRQQNVEVKRAVRPFDVESVTYPVGTYVVFLAQPKMGLIKNLIGRTRYPDNQWTRDATGAFTAFDSAADTVNEYMNVAAIPAGAKFEGEFETVEGMGPVCAYKVLEGTKYVLSAKENSAFKAVNMLLSQGFKVYRIDTCPWHDFYVECDGEKIAAILEKAPTVHRIVDKPYEKMTEIKPLKVAMYQRYYLGNADEGWTRLVLENNFFEYTSVFDKDIAEGLAGFDVLILPSDSEGFILGPKNCPEDLNMKRMMQWVGPQPEKYMSGIGPEGALKIKEFVENGGRLLAFNQTCDFAINYLSLGVKNIVRGLPAKEFNTHGSTLRAKVDNTQNVCYGMPKQAYIFHWNGPSFEISDMFNADKYDIAISYEDKEVLRSGLLTGEKYVAGKGAVVTCRKGAGEVVLYGFGPQNRAQTTGVFKLLFNMLYK